MNPGSSASAPRPPAAALRASLADRYRIERELGAGGMATVYLAEDLRHRRKVAVKVLHPELSAVLGPERFLQEIELTASLQHPHILPLFDSGSAEGQLYYVMPFVDGETLRARLERERQLPIADAVRVAAEVADALAYAHARGVIHRDIKPENVLLQGGHPLVADFGIALAVEQAGGQRMTQTGISLGTPQYMAPEQAMGERAVDARADVYALGAVLHEMLTGAPPFTGPTAQAIVAKVLTERPEPPSAARETVPEHLDRAVLTALARLPADRFASASAMAAALREPAVAPLPLRRRATSPVARWAPWLAAGVLAVALAVALATRSGPAPSTRGVVRFPLGTSAPLHARVGSTHPFAVSTDGRMIAYRAQSGGDSTVRLFLRTLDDPQPRALAGTERADNPSFSPDDRWIAFVVGNRRIMRLPVAGGAPSEVATLDNVTASLSWASNDEIVFEFFGPRGLQRVAASGGAPRELVPLDTARGERMHRRPLLLREQRAVVFASTDRDGRTQLAAAPLEGGPATPLGIPGIHPLGMIGGWLIYAREDGAMMAVRFDSRRLTVTGAPVPLGDRVLRTWGGVAVELSPNGTLVFEPAAGDPRLGLMDTASRVTPVIGEQRPFRGPRVSPDGQHIAVGVGDGDGGDIWLVDRATSALRRLTHTGTAATPEWMPDGRRLLYTAGAPGAARELWTVPIDGSAEPARVLRLPGSVTEATPTPDGRAAVVRYVQGAEGARLLHVTLDGSAPPRPLTTAPNPRAARVSPDGRWIAYAAAREISQIYVSPIAGTGELQVSAAGGSEPVWAPDGRRLYYRTFGSRLQQVDLATGPALRVVARRDVLDDPFVGVRSNDYGAHSADYDVSPDGRTFAVLTAARAESGVLVALDWAADVARRLKEQR